MHLNPCTEKRNSSHMRFPINECRLLLLLLTVCLILHDIFCHNRRKENFTATNFLASYIHKNTFEKYTSVYCIDVFHPEIGWVGILEHAANFSCSIDGFRYLCLLFTRSLQNQIARSERVTRFYLLWSFLTAFYDTWACSISGLCPSSTEHSNFSKWPTWRTILLFYNTFITFPYMFRATSCLSSGGQFVLIQHLLSSLSVSGRPGHRTATYREWR